MLNLATPAPHHSSLNPRVFTQDDAPPSYHLPTHQDPSPYYKSAPQPTGGHSTEYYAASGLGQQQQHAPQYQQQAYYPAPGQQPYYQQPQQGYYPPQQNGGTHYPQQAHQQGPPVQGYYAKPSGGGNGGASGGICAGLLAGLACCCCLDCLF